MRQAVQRQKILDGIAKISEEMCIRDSKKVNAKSIMGMMTLGLYAGETVTVSANGEDEEEALANIENFLSSK